MNYGRSLVEREVDALGLDPEEQASSPWAAALCPLHDDTSASFTINMEEGGWKCHAGCGSSGDLADLIAEVHEEEPRDVRLRLRRSMPSSAEDLMRVLQVGPRPDSPTTDPEVDLTYEHGRAPQYIFGRGFTADVLKDWDVGMDASLNAVVIPVRMDGTLKGLVRRVVDPEPGASKYLNTRFPKGEVLLGLDHLPFDTTEVVVVEGPLDALWLYQHGIPGVALLGSSMSETQAHILTSRFWGAVLAFDADEPGSRGEQRAATLLKGMEVRYARIPEGRGDVQECTAEELRAMLEAASPFRA